MWLASVPFATEAPSEAIVAAYVIGGIVAIGHVLEASEKIKRWVRGEKDANAEKRIRKLLLKHRRERAQLRRLVERQARQLDQLENGVNAVMTNQTQLSRSVELVGGNTTRLLKLPKDFGKPEADSGRETG